MQETYIVHDYLYVPALDGTETIHQLSGTTTISNNELSGGSGFIGAFDNSGDWECSFKAKFSSSNCGVMIIDPSDTTRDNNQVKYVSGDNKVYLYVNGSNISTSSVIGTKSHNTYYDFTIKKENGSLTVKFGSYSGVTVSWSLISSLSTLAIGVDTWGHTATIKNIVVKPL